MTRKCFLGKVMINVHSRKGFASRKHDMVISHYPNLHSSFCDINEKHMPTLGGIGGKKMQVPFGKIDAINIVWAPEGYDGTFHLSIRIFLLR